MNQNVKDLFDGFMATFCRPEDVIYTKEWVSFGPDRSFKILKDTYSDEPDYIAFDVGKFMGNLLNTHELLSETSKIYLQLFEDAGGMLGGKHITSVAGEFTRYKLEVVLEP